MNQPGAGPTPACPGVGSPPCAYAHMSLMHVRGPRSIERPAPLPVLGGAPCASGEQGTLECTRGVWQGSTALAWRTYQRAPLATTGTMQMPHASHNNASNSPQKHSHCGSVRAPMRVGPRDGCQASSLDAPLRRAANKARLRVSRLDARDVARC